MQVLAATCSVLDFFAAILMQPFSLHRCLDSWATLHFTVTFFFFCKHPSIHPSIQVRFVVGLEPVPLKLKIVAPQVSATDLVTRSHSSTKVHMAELADFMTSPVSNFNKNSECSTIIITWKQNWSSTRFESITFLKHLQDLLLMPVQVCLPKLLLFRCHFDLNNKMFKSWPLIWQSISFCIEYEFHILVFRSLLTGQTILINMSYSGATLLSSFIQIWNVFVFIFQVAEVAQILDFLSTQTALPIVGISGGSAVVIPYKVLSKQRDFSIFSKLSHHQDRA